MATNEGLLLTREDVVPILEKHHKNGILNFMGFVEDILAKAKPVIEKRERERIAKEILDEVSKHKYLGEYVIAPTRLERLRKKYLRVGKPLRR